ncbi:MAG: uracil-DNA glycosylase [Phycisphaerae bacterium]|nr:uracil-DNA glycosylase [Phycisphaerae bacterium]
MQPISSVIRQQVETDRLLGLDFVPLNPRCWRSVGQANRPGGTAGRRGGVPGAAAHQTPRTAGGKGDTGRAAENAERLRVLDETQVRSCTKCTLCKERTRTVFGQGNPDPRLVFVGEAPGFEEDRQGLAFVGRAGQLLTRMIAAMGLTRDDVYICNTVKCRPPNNRVPTAEEILACNPYLREQLSILRPEVIVALGAPASKTLLGTAESISRLRGRFHDFTLPGGAGESNETIPLMPTFHPAYLLRSPEEKRKAWEDLQQVMNLLGLERPANT